MNKEPIKFTELTPADVYSHLDKLVEITLLLRMQTKNIKNKLFEMQMRFRKTFGENNA